MVTRPNTDAKACNQLQLPKLPSATTVLAESPARLRALAFFFCWAGWASFFPGALMGGGGHIRYSRTVQYGTLRMYAEEPPVRDAPGRYSPLPESFISDTNNSTKSRPGAEGSV